MSFWIKICGIKDLESARAAADAGADAVGLNFFNESRRYISPQDAHRIADDLPPGILKVGVFVNHDIDQVSALIDRVGLNAVQLHGDEPPTLLIELPPHVRIVRAFRCGKEGLAPFASYLESCHSLGRMPDAVLIDADAGTTFGGTGSVADWTTIRQQKELLGGLPLILAGGLNPANVAAAVEAVEPDGVDVASGVERAPGLKDVALIAQFVTAARDASHRILR